MIQRLALLLGWILVASGPPALASAPGRVSEPLTERRPELWAVIVGIDEHTDSHIPDSKTAVESAYQVHEWFLKQAGWDRGHLLLLVDLGAEKPGTPDTPAFPIQATRKNLSWAFDVWLKEKSRPGDLIIVYYAGRSHAELMARGEKELGRVDYLLLPRDATLADAAQTGFSLTKALNPYARQGNYQVVCWLGTGLEDQPAAKTPSQPESAPSSPRAPLVSPAKPTGRDWIRGLARWPGVTAWLASDVMRNSRRGDEPWVSFTSALIDGLGDPDRKNNLAACLRSMQQNSTLKLHGFQAVGGVPPTLSLWQDQFVESLRPSRPEMVLQIGHADRIRGLATSADSRHLFTASADSTIRIWSLEDRALLRILTGHEVGANTLALSRDGKWLISGGGRSGVMVHAVHADYESKIINRQPHGRRVEQVMPLPDGYHFISVDDQARSFLWDLREPALTPRAWLEKIDCLEAAAGGGAGAKEPGTVAARCGDGSVRIFNRSGAPREVVSDHQGIPTSLAVSPDGRSLVYGFEDGRFVIRDIDRKATAEHAGTNGRVNALAFSRSGRLAVSGERGVEVYVVTTSPKPTIGPGKPLAPWPVSSLAFSGDGRYLVACARDTGELRVWKFEGDSDPREVATRHKALALTSAFTADGQTLVVGGKDGSVKTIPIEPKDAEAPWERAADRGKVQQLSASPSRRFLLIRNDRSQLQIWDLKERVCQRLSGRWAAGAFLDDRRLALIVAADAAESPGKLVLMNRENSEIDATFFKRSAEGYEIGDDVAFGTVAISPDGSLLAASAIDSQVPLVCIWETATGRLSRWATEIERPVLSLDFSDDNRYLLTAGNSPEASLWEIKPGNGPFKSLSRTFHDQAAEEMTRAIFRPGSSRMVVGGYRDGRVAVWTWKDGQETAKPRSFVAAFGRAVKALAFTPDGRYLAVAGDSFDLWVGEVDPSPRRSSKLNDDRPHHFEQINALVAWPAPPHLLSLKIPSLDGSAAIPILLSPPPLLLSGSDDTTVKFWDLDGGSLRATFSAAGGGPRLAANGDVPSDIDWVVYTPEGRFDASGNGRNLVRFRRKDQARLLEQFDSSLYAFQLGDQVRLGGMSEPTPSLEEPPPLAIDPPRRNDDSNPETELTISLGAADLRDFRVYHNDVPISTGYEDAPAGLPETVRIPVRLVRGSNRFYAMASRPNAYDSRSAEIDIRYSGPREPGRVHILALGVGDYARRRLSYPERDARRISEVLQRRGIDAQNTPGMKIVLTNEEVTQERVGRAFRELVKQVRRRPQDTVVVFLAGHTGVFDQQKFCLLLNSYPFPADAPIMVAARDADAIPEKDLKPEYILPYATIAANMMRLDALNRLVIVDACQAEAIYSDPEVTEIRKWMEIGSRKARTSYLMAARKGEPALEIDPLQHGVFTYTLLRGMRATTGREPKEISRLKIPRDADFDRDGTLTTGELDSYVKQTMPLIAAQFPRIVASRRDAENRVLPAGTVPASELSQESRIQTVTTSFPLVPAVEAGAAAP